jgi:hypothetical protein
MGWGVSASSRESVGVLGSAVVIMLYGLGCIGELSRECGCVVECGGHNPLWFNLTTSSGCLYVLLDCCICDVIWVGVYRRALARV